MTSKSGSWRRENISTTHLETDHCTGFMCEGIVDVENVRELLQSALLHVSRVKSQTR